MPELPEVETVKNFLDLHLLYIYLLIFIIAWVGQFIGHKIEGQKPSFFEDIQFLLIGPAWIISFIYKKMGINFLDFFKSWNFTWIKLGLLRTWLGWLLVLGSC